MKKAASILLAAAMVLCLAACGGNNNSTPAEPSSTAETLTGTAEGYGGAVNVTLTREGGKITACTIEGKDETAEIGGKALPDLEQQVVAKGGYDIDGVSGATVTTKAVKKAVAAALGEEYKEEAPAQKPAEPAEPAPIVPIEGGIQLGLAYGAAHGTKCFTEAYAVVKDDVIVAAFIDEFQFVAADAGLDVVPNSDADFGKDGFAEGKALASKRAVADYYSKNMAEKGGATLSLMDNFKAVENFTVGKTIAEIEAVAANKEGAVDAVSGATLVDTAGYLGVIAEAAKNAQKTQAVEFTGDSSAMKLNVAYGAAHGTKCFTAAAAVTDGDKIVLSYLDEFQFVAADASLDVVPNSDADFGKDGFAAGKALASKRAVADYYSKNMSEKGGATIRIDDNFNAIQNHVNGMTIADAKALAGQENATDAVSGATLTDTAGYVGVIVAAAEG